MSKELEDLCGDAQLAPGDGATARFLQERPAVAKVPVSEDALRLLVGQHGVRGTARLLEMDVQETEAFRKRIQRAGWCQEPEMKPLIAAISRNAVSRPVVSALSPMQAIQAEMKQNAVMGRAAALRVSRRALEQADKLPDADLLVPDNATTVKTWVQSASIAGGYSASDAVTRVDLRVTASRDDAGAEVPQMVEAEWTESVEPQGFTEI